MTQVATGQPTTITAKAQFAGPVPCLTFGSGAEQAVNFYVSLFRNARIVRLVRSETDGPVPKGQVLHATFELDGHPYIAFDGGPTFTFTEGFSMVATCETQEELDALWRRLTENGGEEGPCGWCKDRFGVSWQVVPAALGEMMSNPAGGNPGRMMEALLKMRKLDIAALKRAYES
ncbi:MAG TPA: VOC family protein [Candidatus Dormibacteraeota bacterium]|nr:VOC family protein [Candidatus Dormibacteraeota bacterium]